MKRDGFRNVALAFATAASLAGSAAADARPPVNAYSAGLRNSAQRHAIVAAVRPFVHQRFGRDADILVDHIRVRNGWAVFWGFPDYPRSRRPDAPPRPSVRGMHITALLQFRDGGWHVVRHTIGDADNWYCDASYRAARRATQC